MNIDVAKIIIYMVIMAGVTYLIRMLPLALFKKKIQNRFVKSFLAYVPYAVLSAMTFPAVFYSTDSVISAVIGTAVSLGLAYFGRGLLTVAIGGAVSVFIVEFIMSKM